MKYLKSYKLFESIKPFDESIFQELMDEASYNFISLPGGHFCIEIKDCDDETMVSKAVKKLNLDIECRYSKVEKNYYIFDMGAINKFKCLIEDLKMKKYNNGDLIFKKDTVVLMHQENGYIWVKFCEIWSVFEYYFHTEPRVNRGFMSNLIEEVFKFRPLTPLPLTALL